MQARQQQQAALKEASQPSQQTAVGPVQNTQQAVSQSLQSTVSQQSGLQPYQPVAVASGVPNVTSSLHQVPHSVVPAGAVPGSAPQPQAPTGQQFNTASLCFMGQETVQDIVSKVLDMFQILRNLYPPVGTVGSMNQSNEKRAKLTELIKNVKTLFKRLRLIYEKCNDDSQLQGMEYMHIESLIPIKEEWDMKTSEERKTSEAYRLVSEEYKELIDQVIVKNALIKEVIDHFRRIVWEINTMLMMRKS